MLKSKSCAKRSIVCSGTSMLLAIDLSDCCSLIKSLEQQLPSLLSLFPSLLWWLCLWSASWLCLWSGPCFPLCWCEWVPELFPAWWPLWILLLTEQAKLTTMFRENTVKSSKALKYMELCLFTLQMYTRHALNGYIIWRNCYNILSKLLKIILIITRSG